MCIEDGASLSINNLTVNIDGYYSITVHKGGTLNLDNAGLQPTAGNTWYGITVLGDNDQPLCDEATETLNTDHHGMVSAESSAIFNSTYGIKLEGYNDNFSGGGIIKINNCKFINQTKVAIYMGSYEVLGSNCYVNAVANSEFITYDPNSAPEAFIEMVSHRGLTVLGCRFENTSFHKLRTIGIKVRERTSANLEAGRLILEASEYENPYEYETSAKFSPSKRNIFKNLKTGISIVGNLQYITPSESIIKNCDFVKVRLGIYLEKVQIVDILCNTYTAQIYDDANPMSGSELNFSENQEDALGNKIPIPIATQSNPAPYSIFAHGHYTYGEINFFNNYCEWNDDFSDKQAIGIYLNQHNDPSTPLAYAISGNTFTSTSTESNLVTGMIIHGVFTNPAMQLYANQFTDLYRDIHLKGITRRAGGSGSCFYPVLSPQGQQVDYSTNPPTPYTIGNGNIFSSPSLDPLGNIYGDADDVFYIHQPNGTTTDYDPNLRTSCPLVYTSSRPLNALPTSIDCAPPEPHVLLSDDNLLLNGKDKPAPCLTVYPNPAIDKVYISLESLKAPYNLKNANIVIYNSMLQPVFTKSISSAEQLITISGETLHSGLYFVVLKKENKTICINKLIKQ